MPKIKLNNVRLSFPSLFRKAVFEVNETKYEATFLSLPAVDGRVWDMNGAAVGSGSDSDDQGNQALRLGDYYSDPTTYSYRSILAFDTSSLPDEDCTVIGATVEMTRGAAVGNSSPFDWPGVCTVEIETAIGYKLPA